MDDWKSDTPQGRLLELADEAGKGVQAVGDQFSQAYNNWKKEQANKAAQREADTQFVINPVYRRPLLEQTPELQKQEKEAQHRMVDDYLNAIATGAPIEPPKAITRFLGEQAKKVVTPRLQSILDRVQGVYDPKAYAKARDTALSGSEPIDLKKTSEIAGIKPNEGPMSAYRSAGQALGDELARKHNIKPGSREDLLRAFQQEYPEASLTMGDNLENIAFPKSSKEYMDEIAKHVGKDHELVQQGSAGIFTTNREGMPQIIIHPQDDPRLVNSILSHEGQHLQDYITHPNVQTTNVSSVPRLIDDLKQSPSLIKKMRTDLENTGLHIPQNDEEFLKYMEYVASLPPSNTMARNVLEIARDSKNEFANRFPTALDRLLYHTNKHHVETPQNFELERLQKLLNSQR